MLTKCRQLIQPLNANFHKGMAGIITVIGGSADYTGAPYFACHAAAVTGADLSHVVCERRAATVIKSYTPDLMVHPYLRDLEGLGLSDDDIKRIEDTDLDKLLNDSQVRDIVDNRVMPLLEHLLHRLDVLVVGPGFGRDKLMLALMVRIIEEIKVLNKPVVIDADALYLLLIFPKLGAYKRAVLTPNVVEFARIAKAIKVDPGDTELPDLVVNATQNVSKALAGAIIVRKGPYEVIASSEGHLINDQKGLPRRVGGQGDTLVGVTATLLCWSNHYMDQKWDNEVFYSHDEANLLAIYAAANVVRVASKKAFSKYGRAMQTLNVHQYIGEAYAEIFGDAATL